MDIILIGLVQGLFLTAIIAGLVFFNHKFGNREKRPGAEQEPELLKSFKAIFSKLPGLNPDDQILGQDKGSFFSTADINFVWERAVDNLTRFPVMDNKKYNWRHIQPDQPYRRIILNADWSDKHKLVSGHPNAPDSMMETSFTLMCILQFEQLEAGGTAIHFDYRFSGPDLLGERLKRNTNARLRNICLQLTQDPTRGTPF